MQTLANRIARRNGCDDRPLPSSDHPLALHRDQAVSRRYVCVIVLPRILLFSQTIPIHSPPTQPRSPNTTAHPQPNRARPTRPRLFCSCASLSQGTTPLYQKATLASNRASWGGCTTPDYGAPPPRDARASPGVVNHPRLWCTIPPCGGAPPLRVVAQEWGVRDTAQGCNLPAGRSPPTDSAGRWLPRLPVPLRS